MRAIAGGGRGLVRKAPAVPFRASEFSIWAAVNSADLLQGAGFSPIRQSQDIFVATFGEREKSISGRDELSALGFSRDASARRETQQADGTGEQPGCASSSTWTAKRRAWAIPNTRTSGTGGTRRGRSGMPSVVQRIKGESLILFPHIQKGHCNEKSKQFVYLPVPKRRLPVPQAHFRETAGIQRFPFPRPPDLSGSRHAEPRAEPSWMFEVARHLISPSSGRINNQEDSVPAFSGLSVLGRLVADRFEPNVT